MDITTSQRKTILEMLKRYLPDTAVWAYGSRVKWTSRPESDLDMVVFASPDQKRQVSDLKEALEESDLPFRVDVFEWDEVPEGFRKNIEAEHVVLQEQSERSWVMGNKYPSVSLKDQSLIIKRGIGPKYVEDGGLLVINQRCIRDQRVQLKNARRNDPKKKHIPQDRFLVAYDVLVNSTGVGTLGRVGQLLSVQEPSTVDSHVTIVRPDAEKVDPYYFGFAIRSIEGQIEALGEGSTGQTELSRERLAEIEIPIPTNRSDQRAIAHILGSLDDKIELNRQMNRTLEKMAQAIFKSWFIDFDPVKRNRELRRVNCENSKETFHENSPFTIHHSKFDSLFPDSFENSELGEIPKGWEVKPLSSIIRLIGGGTPKTSVPEYWNGDIPWFSVVDAPSEHDLWVIDTEKHVSQAGIENSSTKILPVKTTIISARGTVGKCALVGCPMAMNQSCYGIRPVGGYGEICTNFTVRNQIVALQRSGHGSVFNTITRATFDSIRIADSGCKISSAFDRIVDSYLSAIIENLRETSALVRTRDTLLPKLISGELHVTPLLTELEMLK